MHVYEECVGGKGANNIASLVMRGLGPKGMDILKKGDPGGKLIIFYDNCIGQNKNNAVLDLAAYLVECGYFKEVQFVFLIVGHTKNVCDRIFNNLKQTYHKTNVWAYSQLLRILSQSYKVTVHNIMHGDFYQWDEHLKKYYRAMAGKITKNHIFCCRAANVTTTANGTKKVIMELFQSCLSQHTAENFQLCK